MNGDQLFAAVKGALVARHTSLHKVCNANGIKRQNARKALKGEWKGPKGLEVRAFLMKEAGFEVDNSEGCVVNQSCQPSTLVDNS